MLRVENVMYWISVATCILHTPALGTGPFPSDHCETVLSDRYWARSLRIEQETIFWVSQVSPYSLAKVPSPGFVQALS